MSLKRTWRVLTGGGSLVNWRKAQRTSVSTIPVILAVLLTVSLGSPGSWVNATPPHPATSAAVSQAAQHFSIKVVDQSGHPLSNVSVQAFLRDPQGQSITVFGGSTDPNGFYSTDSVP